MLERIEKVSATKCQCLLCAVTIHKPPAAAAADFTPLFRSLTAYALILIIETETLTKAKCMKSLPHLHENMLHIIPKRSEHKSVQQREMEE